MRKRSRLIGIKLPDSNTMGLKFIKHLIKVCTKEKLYGIQGMIEGYPDSQEKTEIKEMLKREFVKRGYDWIE
jgi:hypothetical protein